MSLGVEVRNRIAPPTSGFPIDTDTLFLAWDGEGGSGTLLAAVECRSLADFVAVHGARAVANAEAYDYLDNYFREGGRKAYTARHTTAGTYTAALALFHDGLGSGQLAVIGTTQGDALYQAMQNHAEAYGRVALFDVNVDDTIAEMDTLADVVAALDDPSYGALFGPWVTVPAPAGISGGTARSIPASSSIAALCARADALGNPNRAAAGRDFPLQYATGFTVPVSDADRVALLNAGCNTFASKNGLLQNYGFQTGIPQADAESDPFWQFNCSRTRMWIGARAKATGENYMFKPIDGQGRLARSLQTDLEVILLDLWAVNGLFGLEPSEAFNVEVGASVNTEDTIAQGELYAVCEARLTIHAKRVLIDLVHVPITGRVSV
jgi:hypothetical protein